MSQHTPTTEDIHDQFVAGAMVTGFANSRAEATADWYGWLHERDARISAAAEQRGAARSWDEAIDYVWDDSAIYQADAARAKAANPYRADLLEGDE
jgi:hypothetical protein